MYNNPFFYGGIAENDFFCNRILELNEIQQDIYSGLNLLIFAPRRFGKTSLVKKVIENKNIRYIFIDFTTIVDEKDFINNYINAFSKMLNTTDKFMHFIKDVVKIRPNVIAEFSSNNEPKFSLNFTKNQINETIDEVMSLPFEYAKKSDKKIVVIFDEFQEVVNLNIEARLRSIIQHHSNTLSYIFLGSKKSIMRELFFDKLRPFYKSVKHLPIQAINNDIWIKFIKTGFEKYNKSILEEHINIILDITKGFPYYTQQLSYELFAITQKECNDDLIKKAIKSTINKEKSLFALELSHLTTNQHKALKAITKSNGKNIYSQELLRTYDLTSSTIKRAVESLLKKDILDLEDGVYYFQDPLFEYYLQL